jgi:molecular chaperone HscB
VSASSGQAFAAARDHFSLMGLPLKYALDADALERAWRALQAAVHPDRFASATPSQQRLALQYSTAINEAHDTLKDPMRRAAYLCELNGVAIDAERNTAMPADFLVQQMEWRESLDDAVAARNADAIGQLQEEVQSAVAETELLVEHLLDRAQPDYVRASGEVRRMMFLQQFKRQLIDEQRRLARGASADR